MMSDMHDPTALDYTSESFSYNFKSEFAKSFVKGFAEKRVICAGNDVVLQNICTSRKEDYIASGNLCLKTETCPLDRYGQQSAPANSGADFEKVLDRERAMEELRGSSCRTCFSYSVDMAVMQSRVETLGWQLLQVEQSHQMYRSLMEQVLKFLERLCTNLDEMSSTEQCDSLPASVNSSSSSHMVARCRSVLSVDGTSSRSAAADGRETTRYILRAKSTAQIEESPSAFCEYTWRRSPKAQHEGALVHRMSQDTYRLLRTVKSLLSTSVPSLAQSTDCDQRAARGADEVLARMLPDEDGRVQRSLQDLSLGEALVQSTPARKPSAEPRRFSSLRRAPPLCSASALPAVSRYTASLGRPGKVKRSQLASPTPPECYVSDAPSEKQLSVSSNEDESGFSSMSSFQEVGLPPAKTPSPEHPAVSYPEVGLPSFQPGERVPNHRRWSSVPAGTPRCARLQPESSAAMWV